MISSWNKVPDEILYSIQKLVDSPDLKQCLLVSKQWFNMCQPIFYKDVRLSLDFGNSLFNTLLHSQFQSGQWVRNVIIENFVTPCKAQDLDPATDPLLLLMQCCPHVVKVDFEQPTVLSRDQADYYIRALAKVKTWKLREVPHYTRFAVKNQRYKLESLLKHTLTTIDLDGIYNKGTFDFLTRFNKIQCVTVSAKDLVDCVDAIKLTPNLDTLYVDFNRKLKSNETVKDIGEATIQPCPALKRLELWGHVPSTGQELLFIASQFKSVNHLKFTGSRCFKPTQVSQDEIDAFTQFLHNIPIFAFELCAQQYLEWLNSYYINKGQQTISNNNSNKLELSFIDHRMNPGYTIKLSNKTASLELCSKEPAVVKNDLEKVFSNIGHHIQEVDVLWSHVVSINTFLEILLQRCRSLKTLTFTTCHIEGGGNQGINNDHQSVSHLVLNRVVIHDDGLAFLSKILPRLESLHMINPRFTSFFQNSSIQDINGAKHYLMTIHLRYTELGSLSMEFPLYDAFSSVTPQAQIVKRDSVAFVILSGQEKQKYYVKYGDEDIIYPETFQEFSKLRERGLSRPSRHRCDRIDIDLIVGSIKKFSFVTPHQNFTLEF